MKKKDAEAIDLHIKKMIHHANHVLCIANNSGDLGFKSRAQKVLGSVVAELDFELLVSIYKEFPELKPDSL